MTSSLAYRPEIDGLRALAVLPVILFHGGFPGFGGGFVGVDIFFVISGYLITSIILDDIKHGKFDLVSFYERRARRLLPALLLVISACIPFAWVWMLPDPLENFGQSIVATSLFSNNILLWLTTGYWEQPSEFKPLLHTWSLGVEEQFYFVYPLVLLLAARFEKTFLVWSVILLSFISLLLSVLATNIFPEFSFFMLATRAWELLAGGLCAFCTTQRLAAISIRISHHLSVLGFLLILFSLGVFNHGTNFPGINALLPVSGTVLLILFTKQGSFLFSLLTSRPLVATGLISYSAYLWHQPLFAFSRIYSQVTPSYETLTLLTGLTFVLAYLTWRFVEKPFRRGEFLQRRIFISLTLLSYLVVIGIGLSLHFNNGFPSRFQSSSGLDARTGHIDYNHSAFEFISDGFQGSKEKSILFIGDSYARDFINISRRFIDFDRVEVRYKNYNNACSSTTMEERNIHPDVDLVLVAFMAWEDYECLSNMIRFLTEIDVNYFVVGPKNFGSNLNWVMRFPEANRSLLENAVDPDMISQESRMREVVDGDNYISLMDALVGNDGVLITDRSGNLISFDRLHLTRDGAKFIGDELEKTLLEVYSLDDK